MKKSVLFFLIAVLVSLCSTQQAKAQVTAITPYFFDSTMNYCTAPAYVNGYGYYMLTGTPAPNDSITVYINYGDGSDTTYKVETVNQGNFYVEHTYMVTGTFQLSITLTNTNNVTTTILGQNYVVSNNCSAISGDVWLDANNNCVFDTGEQPLHWSLVKVINTSLTNTEYYTWIDGNGHYSIEVPDGYTYTVQMADMPNAILPTCPNTTGIVTQAVSGGTYTINLGYECNTSFNQDHYVYGWAYNFRPGHTRYLSVHANTDNFCASFPATVTLVLDPLLTCTGVAAGTAPTTNTGSVVTWVVTSLGQYNYLTSTLDIYCDPSATLGDTLCNTVYITYTGTDPNINNDTAHICRPVSNSWDPNNKIVSQGEGPLGTIAPETELAYVINFQNTGNDTAYNITVVDTLSSNVDVSTFQLLETSHPVNVTWLSGNIINFRFEGINLPDSNVNEPLSHGFITYKATVKTGLAPNTQITNTAHIYFDFNPAIVTNTTLNTIAPLTVQTVDNGSMAAEVYPNPANDQFTIVAPGNDKFSAQLFDVLGRPVAASSTNNGKTIINTAALSSGMYMLHINANGKQLTTKLHVQH